MPIKHRLLLVWLFVIFLLLCSRQLQAQAVWENHRYEIYHYLYRMAQKGMIRFDDLIQPVSRNDIAKGLQALLAQKDKLAKTEQGELEFYLKEYGNPETDTYDDTAQVKLFRKDRYHRWRSFTARNSNFLINADPLVGGFYTYRNGQSYTQSNIGGQLWGRIGRHFGFQFYARDVTESGTGIDKYRSFTPETGAVLQSDTNKLKSQNYSEVRASLSYSWKNGSISLGQDYLLWGYGLNGRIVSSDKAPAYPYIRLDYQPFNWLRFNYTHAWLNSNVIDSSRTYNYGNSVFGGRRDIYVSKFMASHSITLMPVKGLDVSVGESIVYTDRLEVGFLIPIMFFKVYDNISSNNNIRSGSNGQFFFQVSSRNQLPKTHLYATLLVDEIRISKIFNSLQKRNQLGFNAGASVTDVGIPYLTLNAEYTRINPFVYNNLNPAQNYTNHGYSLGDWMGNNADRWMLGAQYTPLPRLKLEMRYQYLRKGGPGTPEEQYFAEPQPSFLSDYRFSQGEVFLGCSYEWINNLYLRSYLTHTSQTSQATGAKDRYTAYSIGFSYGL